MTVSETTPIPVTVVESAVNPLAGIPQPIANFVSLHNPSFVPNGKGTVGALTGSTPANLTVKGWLTFKDPSGNLLYLPCYG
jgi:hypothetical protein